MTTERTPRNERAKRDASLAPISALSRLFIAWRGVIGAAVLGARRLGLTAVHLARGWVDQWRLAWAYHAGDARALRSETTRDEQAAAAIGARAFVFGLILTAVIASTAAGGGAGPGFVAAMTEALWAAARFIIMALLLPKATIDRHRLSIAFLAGLLPYAIGATAVLRLLALGGSAFLTVRGLTGAGVSRRDAGTAIAWSFGGHAAAMAVGWIARAVFAFVAAG